MFLMLYITSPWHLFYNWRFKIPFTYYTHCLNPLHILWSMFLYGLVCFLDSIYKWNHIVFLCLISLSVIPSRSIQVVANGKMPFSFGWVTFHCMHKPHFLYPFIPWILRLLPYLAIINNVTMNIGVHTSFWISIFVFFKYIPRNKIAWSCDSSIFYFFRNLQCHFPIC